MGIEQDAIKILKEMYNVNDTYVCFDKIAKLESMQLNNLSNEQKQYIIDKCDKLLECENVYFKYYVYSFVLYTTYSDRHLKELIEFLMKLDDVEMQYTWFKTISRLMFLKGSEFNENSLVLLTKFLRGIVENAKNHMPAELFEPIPPSARNDKLGIVLTKQILSLKHGPSKHALDHCATLIRSLGKQVLFINTAESGAGTIKFPVYNYFQYNYEEKLTECEKINFDGVDIPFFQCANDMPNVPEVQMLIETVRQLKPAYVVEIGTGSLVAGLIDSFIPVLSNGTMHSLIETSATRYQTIARDITATEKEMLTELGLSENNLIYSMFTTKVREKTDIVNREMLGIPEDAFAVALIGNRLHTEVTPELVKSMMESVEGNSNIYYILFGGCDAYEQLVEGYENKAHIINYGPAKDTIACIENCDLYLNPPRVGGGMSAIEAMAVGIPAVSTSYGDGGVVLGKDFWVDEPGDFASKIVQYSTDSEYYMSQSNIARERGKYLQDSDKVFTETIADFLKKIN